MLVKSYGAAIQGVSALLVTIEVNVSPGIRFFLVGLPDNAVKESHERIMSALQHNQIPPPRKQVIINMAPADLKKEGAAYDLPLAIGMLAANGTISDKLLASYLIMGELSLDGTLKPVKGVLPIAILAKEKGFKGIILPASNAREAAVVSGLDVYGVESITEVVELLDGASELQPVRVDARSDFFNQQVESELDFADVKGQEQVKRAFEIAAAGSHNIILIGPPGAGKSMMAKRLPSILPPLTLRESLETTKVHSVAGRLGRDATLVAHRPFRSPHHTISDVAMVGGGGYPQPGEISLAHNGVLFLDELPEFKRSVLEVMRQPLEDRKIQISRARFSLEYPASFMLVASMNPCPCGYYNHPDRECVCGGGVVQRYLSKISGPLLDRIDIHIEITPVPFEKLSESKSGESSLEIRERVMLARRRQSERFKDEESVYCNAQMSSRHLQQFVRVDEASRMLLKQAMHRMNLSARAYDRILKLSRTIADLSDCDDVLVEHVAEAITYRNLDREGWAG